MDILQKIGPSHLKMAGAALLLVKALGFVKTIVFLLGGLAGYLLARQMHEAEE